MHPQHLELEKRVSLEYPELRSDETNGRLNAEDMNQLTDVGINAWKYLADAEGKSIARSEKCLKKAKSVETKQLRQSLMG